MISPESLLARFPDAPLWRLSHPDGSPYLDRYVLWGLDCLENHSDKVRSNCFLHRIYTADADRHLHNHPWCWAEGLVLKGGYTEKRSDRSSLNCYGTKFEFYGTGDKNMLAPHEYHSIVSVEADTWTLFLTGPETQDWGFQVFDEKKYQYEHIPHAKYFKRKDVQCMKTERLR